MCQLVESIYLKDGKFRNLDYHQSRMESSVRELFGIKSFRLQEILDNQIIPAKGLYKTRVVYHTSIIKIEFEPYTIKPVRSIKLIEDNDITYSHKYVERSRLTELYSMRGDADDVLIAKQGLITDTYYGNVIFKRGRTWYTPASFLLRGTMRQSLLDSGLIRETKIDISNYSKFEAFKIINAMLGMDGEEIPVTSIC